MYICNMQNKAFGQQQITTYIHDMHSQAFGDS